MIIIPGTDPKMPFLGGNNSKNPTNLARLLGAPLTVSIHFIYSEDEEMISIIKLNIVKNYKILFK